jgi:hypothetical protein
MKKIKVSDITNATIRSAAEQRKMTSAFLVAIDPLQPNALLFYMPWGAEVIDDSGTPIWNDSPDFATVKARILTQPVLVKDVLAQLRGVADKKTIVKIRVAENEIALRKVEITAGGTVVLS